MTTQEPHDVNATMVVPEIYLKQFLHLSKMYHEFQANYF